MIAAIFMGKLLTWSYRRHCKKMGIPFERKKQQDLADFPIEMARMEIALPILGVTALTVLGWGWVMQYRVPIGVPCVLLIIIGFGMVSFNNASSALLVDVNPGAAGAATAANNLVRCLVGAAATAAINPMIKGIGSGWTFVIIGGLILAGIPVVLLIMSRGMKWRKEKAARNKSSKQRKEEKAKAETEK